MKKILLICISFALCTSYQAQNFGETLNNFFGNPTNNNNSNSKNNSKGNPLGRGLSNFDISEGLKEALSIGTNYASNTLSARDGFFKNAAVKILMPKELQHVETTLRKFGLGNLADDLILTMNRAAEDAAKLAAPIFLDAIKKMTLNDAISILNGGNGAATNFLKQTTQQQLILAFSPVIKKSLSKTGADVAWEKVFTAYNRVGIFQKVNTDLTQYVTEKSTDGMFYMISKEENKIRKNPAGYSSKLIQKVFTK